nr:hypothetical protein [Tanacetum cinerariifolium]
MVKFGNDQIAPILGYEDLVQGAVMIKWVYYVEGMNHNLFSIGYSTQLRAYIVFNKRTRVIVETIHVNFDKLPQMASDHISSDPAPKCQWTVLEHVNLNFGLQCHENVTQADRTVTTSNELDFLFSLMFDELLNGSSKVDKKDGIGVTADDLKLLLSGILLLLAGFDQIVDFLNAQVIHYALIVNPTIYVSRIKQFWDTASIKKSDASAGFDQIVDFLNAQFIHYALIVNPDIYVSRIKQFWDTASIKKVNDVVKLQALIDRKKCACCPTSPSPTHEPLPPPHKPIPTPPQAQPAPPSSPPQEQPITASAPDMTLLNTLMETCTTLSHKVAALKQDKVAQALEIFKLKRREDASKKGEGIIKAIDVDEDITLVDIETEVDLDTELQGRIERKDDDNAAAKEVNAAKPTVFDDEE